MIDKLRPWVPAATCLCACCSVICPATAMQLADVPELQEVGKEDIKHMVSSAQPDHASIDVIPSTPWSTVRAAY